ncbi:hypothetical protein [Streptomyces sp. NBC_01343]|uniref:hypothetical protein n=1 Tax=Streptomyces sp. NBC_01343 TaxID=2903832 RepID=UPI003FA35354
MSARPSWSARPGRADHGELWGREAGRTQERLRRAGSWEERFAIAESVLARRYEAGRRVDPEVAFVWERLVTHRGGVAVERLAAEAGWSRKRLWSRFRSQVGIGPKRAARLVRFDEAAHRLAAGRSPAQGPRRSATPISRTSTGTSGPSPG